MISDSLVLRLGVDLVLLLSIESLHVCLCHVSGDLLAVLWFLKLWWGIHHLLVQLPTLRVDLWMLGGCVNSARTDLFFQDFFFRWQRVRILILICIAFGGSRITVIDRRFFSCRLLSLIFLLFGLNGLLFEGKHLEELGAATPCGSLVWLHFSKRREKLSSFWWLLGIWRKAWFD